VVFNKIIIFTLLMILSTSLSYASTTNTCTKIQRLLVDDPCECITCESYCYGTTLRDAYCIEGDCIDLTNHPSCAGSPDPCASITCNPGCIPNTYTYKTGTCINGACQVITNSALCGYVPPIPVIPAETDEYTEECSPECLSNSNCVSGAFCGYGTCTCTGESRVGQPICIPGTYCKKTCQSCLGIGDYCGNASGVTRPPTCRQGENGCCAGKCSTQNCECPQLGIPSIDSAYPTKKDTCCLAIQESCSANNECCTGKCDKEKCCAPATGTYTYKCSSDEDCCLEYDPSGNRLSYCISDICQEASCGKEGYSPHPVAGCCLGLIDCGGICLTTCDTSCSPGATQNRSCGTDAGVCVSGTQSRTCSSTGTWSAWSTCVGQISGTSEICNNVLDDDCDGAIDGNDGDCPEGSGNNSNSTERGCWDDINNNLINNQTDEDDNGCCDVCTSNGFVFDNKYSQNNALGTSCGNISMSWENPGIQSPYCCGDDANEHYITTGIGYEKGLRACCDKATDCIDNNGVCRDNVAEILGNGIDDDCDGTTDTLSENTYEKCINSIDDDADTLTDYPIDNDCIGSLSGTIYEDKNPGMIIEGATVKGIPAIESKYQSKSSLSDYKGIYGISQSLVGTYTFIASKKDYIDDIKTITIISGKTTTADFSMKKGTNCHVDCTDSNNICNPSCQGFNQSGETCDLIKDCEYRPKEYLAMISNGTITTQTLCCEGPSTTYPTLKPTVTGDIDTLYDYTFPAKINGVTPVKMHILVWESK